MKVSVAMISYNHERFVAQAIEGALMQQTSFEYEVVIGEDCSTDSTRRIVVDFHKRYPDRIRLLLPERNIGAHKNFAQTVDACTGEYIALLEGDDYWTSPHKLQKQVDFLDAHPDCPMCFHPVRWVYEEGKAACDGRPEHNSAWPQFYREYSTTEDLLREMFIQTASIMFRNGLIDEYPDWLYGLAMGDWPFCALLAEHGPIACLDEVMSIYRNHAGGIWSFTDDERRYREVIEMYERLNAHFGRKYARIIRSILADYYQKLGVLYDQKEMPAEARSCITHSLAAQVMSKQKPALNSIKMLARLSLPPIYGLFKKLLKA